MEIPGISNAYFLRSALNAIRKYRGLDEMDAMDFLPMFREKLKLLEMDEKLMNRSVNEGFSGGEKKRNEILQMAVLEPKLAILDETDSGLDIDALKIVAKGVNCDAQPGARHASWSLTTSACSTTSFPTSSTCWWTGASCVPAARNWQLELEEKGYGSMKPRRGIRQPAAA